MVKVKIRGQKVAIDVEGNIRYWHLKEGPYRKEKAVGIQPEILKQAAAAGHNLRVINDGVYDRSYQCNPAEAIAHCEQHNRIEVRSGRQLYLVPFSPQLTLFRTIWEDVRDIIQFLEDA